jgi:hypothetical protein
MSPFEAGAARALGFAAVVTALLSGCGLRQRAEFDLGCSDVSITPVGAGGYVASGCGETARYACFRRGFEERCIREHDPPAAPAPVPVVAAAPAGRPRSASGFSVEAAAAAIRVAASFANRCVPAGAEPSTARVRVLFAPQGSASEVELTEHGLDPTTSACIEDAFRQASVPVFQGKGVAVRQTLQLAPVPTGELRHGKGTEASASQPVEL